METKKVIQPIRQYLESLKVRGQKILSEETMNDLTTQGAICAAYEFKQENENDHEFLRQFSKWLHEWPRMEGHVEYYLILGMRMGQHLSEEEYAYLERNVTECFDYSHGWYYELNHRRRFHLRITLIMSYRKGFRRLIKKEI